MTGKELKAGARGTIFANVPGIFVVSLAFVAIFAALSWLSLRLTGTDMMYPRYMERILAGELHSLALLLSFLKPAGFAFAALLWLLGGILQVGFLSYCLKAARSAGSGYGCALDGFLFARKVLAILVATAALTALWSLLLFFPGVAAHYRYRQAYYILLDDPEKGALQCIRESKLLMAGNKLDLFLLDLSFLGWHLLSIAVSVPMALFAGFSFPLVSLWLSPYMGVARAAYYDCLLEKIAT